MPTNTDLQPLIDRAAPGQTVTLPPGTFLLHDSLKLRSGVRVVGQDQTVLRKTPSFACPLADYLGYGQYEFTVTEPDRFRVGMGVHILDDEAVGFYTTVATIIGREGERFFIDRPLAHDYLPARNGRVVTVFPLVEAAGVHEAALENVILDGNAQEETFTLNGCRGGGVFALAARALTIHGVEVRNLRGDAVSFQRCIDVSVRRCHLHDVTGHGLHPGSGSVRYLMEANHVHHCGGDGLFYCLRTTHSTCAANRLEHNGRSGISIGERDTDHLITGNDIAHHRDGAISFRKPLHRSGDRVAIVDNRFHDNGAADGPAQVVIPAGLRDIRVADNSFTGDAPAMSVEPGCQRVWFTGNSVNGRPQTPRDVIGQVGFDNPHGFPAVGHEAPTLTDSGARHLNVERLDQSVIQIG